MTDPLVSVIIPTYNRMEHLQLAIESVLSQTFSDFELIVVDDGSTDNTKEMISQKYLDKLTYVWQENQERSTSRNNGVSLARGKYIAFLDSDDFWEKEKLSILVSNLEDPRNKDYILACSSVWRTDLQGSRLTAFPSGRIKNLPDMSLEDFFEGPKIYASPSNMLIRTEYLRKAGGFDPSIFYGEDWDLIIRLRSLGKFLYIDIPLLNYRVNPNSTQEISDETNIQRYLTNRLRILDKNSYLLQDDGSTIQKTKASLFEETACRYFAVGNLNRGFEYLSLIMTKHSSQKNKNRILQQICHWVVLGAVERKNDRDHLEYYLISTFIPNFLQLWPMNFGSPPRKKFLLAWTYHNLASVQNENYNQKYWIRKAILNMPIIVFLPSTIKYLMA